jgi:hypothetical protein
MASFANGFNKKFLRNSVNTDSGINTAISKKSFSPPTVSGLVGWWQPHLGITLNSGSVAAWANQGTLGGSLAQNTAASQPFFNLSGSNTIYPSITFNGSNSLLSDLTASLWTFLHAFSSTTFIISRTDVADPNAQYPILETSVKGAGGGTPGICFFIDDRSGSGFNDRLGFQVKNNNQAIFDLFGANSTAKIPINYQVFEFNVITGSGAFITVDNTLTTAAASGSFSAPQYWGGPQFSLLLGANCKVSVQEILIYSGTLSFEERSVIRKYLNQRYDIPGL